MSRDWQSLLLQSIPLTQAMQLLAQVQTDGRVLLTAPLAPNVNDKGTGFGGSVATLATLAAWVETQRQLDLAGVAAAVEIMVQRGETTYLRPIQAEFSAIATLPQSDDIERFLRLFARKGLARLALTVELHCRGVLVAQFSGDFVARRPSL